jgi:hypothetical protein
MEYPDDWTPEDVQQFKDTVSRILAGMDQVRSQLDLKWQEVSWKRMRELAERVALMGYDFTVEESVLIGTWMLGSARHQIVQAEQSLPDDGEE